MPATKGGNAANYRKLKQAYSQAEFSTPPPHLSNLKVPTFKIQLQGSKEDLCLPINAFTEEARDQLHTVLRSAKPFPTASIITSQAGLDVHTDQGEPFIYVHGEESAIREGAKLCQDGRKNMQGEPHTSGLGCLGRLIHLLEQRPRGLEGLDSKEKNTLDMLKGLSLEGVSRLQKARKERRAKALERERRAKAKARATKGKGKGKRRTGKGRKGKGREEGEEEEEEVDDEEEEENEVTDEEEDLKHVNRFFYCLTHHDDYGLLMPDSDPNSECKYNEELRLPTYQHFNANLSILDTLQRWSNDGLLPQASCNDLGSTLQQWKEGLTKSQGMDFSRFKAEQFPVTTNQPPPWFRENLLHQEAVPNANDIALEELEEKDQEIILEDQEMPQSYMSFFLSAMGFAFTGPHLDDSSVGTWLNCHEGWKLFCCAMAKFREDKVGESNLNKLKPKQMKERSYSHFLGHLAKLEDEGVDLEHLSWNFCFLRAGTSLYMPPNCFHMVLNLGTTTTLEGHHLLLPKLSRHFALGSRYEQTIQDNHTNTNTTVAPWIAVYRLLERVFEPLDLEGRPFNLSSGTFGISIENLLYLAAAASDAEFIIDGVNNLKGFEDGKHLVWLRYLEKLKERWVTGKGKHIYEFLHSENSKHYVNPDSQPVVSRIREDLKRFPKPLEPPISPKRPRTS